MSCYKPTNCYYFIKTKSMAFKFKVFFVKRNLITFWLFVSVRRSILLFILLFYIRLFHRSVSSFGLYTVFFKCLEFNFSYILLYTHSIIMYKLFEEDTHTHIKSTYCIVTVLRFV